MNIASVVFNYNYRHIFLTMLTTSHYWDISTAGCIMSTTSNLISFRIFLILTSHLSPCFGSSLFPSGFQNKIYTRAQFLVRTAYPVYFNFLDLIVLHQFGEGHYFWSFSDILDPWRLQSSGVWRHCCLREVHRNFGRKLCLHFGCEK
jgi:hypothetical protein